MDKTSFIKLIDNTKSALEVDIEGVRMISEKYPFFTAAKIQELLLLNNQSQEFRNKLSEVAALVPDRKNLLNLLQSRSTPTLNNVAEIKHEEIVAKEPSAASNGNGDNYSHNISTDEAIELSFFDEATETPETSEDIVNFEIVGNNVDDNQVSFLEISHTDNPESIDKSSTAKHSDKEPTFIDAQLYTLGIPSEFIDDGNYESLMPRLNIDESSEERQEILEDLEIINEKTTKEPQSLIDYFIEVNPRIEKPKPIDPNVEIEDISLSSLKESEDVATEQLAIIYRAQGLYEKSISIYEKLCLKFPEKRVYFAGRIESIKNQLKE